MQVEATFDTLARAVEDATLLETLQLLLTLFREPVLRLRILHKAKQLHYDTAGDSSAPIGTFVLLCRFA